MAKKTSPKYRKMAKPIQLTESIFDLLNRKQVCYAVVVSYIKHKMMVKVRSKYSNRVSLQDKTDDASINPIDNTTREYAVIVTEADAKKHKLPRFYYRNYKGVLEYEMGDLEVADFMTRLEQFNKVLHDNDGRVYELKDKPFKAFFEGQKVYEVVGQTSN